MYQEPRQRHRPSVMWISGRKYKQHLIQQQKYNNITSTAVLKREFKNICVSSANRQKIKENVNY